MPHATWVVFRVSHMYGDTSVEAKETFYYNTHLEDMAGLLTYWDGA